MSTTAVFDPFGPTPNTESMDAFLADWDRQRDEIARLDPGLRTATGSSYVYAFHDATGSIFYIGKGYGNRAHDLDCHRHGRLGYYVAEFLGGTYTANILRDGLSPDDAEDL